MGVKTGTFVSRNGRTYEVLLSGDKVTTGTIMLSGVSIGMAAGDCKYVGFKSTTAIVNLLTDDPLIELYSASTRDIRLIIRDVTDDVIEFYGYVTPFAFDRPYTGKNDIVTVNAVDLLTALKDMPYIETFDTLNDPYGTDRKASTIIKGIAFRAGITEIVEHLNFNGSSDIMASDSPLNVMVAQAGFHQDEVSEVDALSAICKFFGYTACVVGQTLYLYDEHCLTHAAEGKRTNANVYKYSSVGWVLDKHYYGNDYSPLFDILLDPGEVHNDISVTIERAYDGIQITPVGSDTSVLLPDVCADDNVVDLEYNDGKNGAMRIEDNKYNGDFYANIYRTPKSSKLVDLSNLVSGDTDYMNGFGEGSVLMSYDIAKRESVTVDGESLGYFSGVQHRNLLWVKMPKSPATTSKLFRQKEEKRYSHTGGAIKLSLSVRVPDISGYDGHTVPEGDGIYDKEYWLKWINLVCGSKYLHLDNQQYLVTSWSASKYRAPILKTKEGRVSPIDTSVKYLVGDFIAEVPSDGQIYIDAENAFETSHDTYFIEALSIEGVGDNINTEHSDLRHIFSDKDYELLDVSTILTTRASGVTGVVVDGHKPYGFNARPSIVASSTWKGSYMGRGGTERIPMAGILMEQLRERYGLPHLSYRFTARKRVVPYAAVKWLGGRYTVDAYEWDIMNNTTNITIN